MDIINKQIKWQFTTCLFNHPICGFILRSLLNLYASVYKSYKTLIISYAILYRNKIINYVCNNLKSYTPGF